MKNFLSVLIIGLFALSSSAQEIDKLRLVYNEKEIVSKQQAIDVSNDGKLLVLGYSNNFIKVIDLTTGKQKISYIAKTTSPINLFFNHDGTQIILQDENKIYIHRTSNGELLHELNFEASIRIGDVSMTKNLIALILDYKTIQVYDFDNKKVVFTKKTNAKSITNIAFSKNGSKLIFGYFYGFSFKDYFGKRKKIELIDLETKHSEGSFSRSFTSRMSFDDGDKSVVYCGFNYYNYLFFGKFKPLVERLDLSTNIETMLYNYGQYYSSPNCFLVADKTLLITRLGGSFDVIDLNTGTLTLTTKKDANSNDYFSKKPAVGNRQRIFRTSNQNVFLIDNLDNNVLLIYNKPLNKISGYIFSDANEDFVTVSRDGKIDGSQSAISKLYWSQRNSKKKIPLDATFSQFYTPRLLNAMFANEELAASKIDLTELKPLPEINFLNPVVDTVVFRSGGISAETNLQNFELRFSVTDMGGGIKETNVYQNGKLIQAFAEDVDEKGKQIKKESVLNLVPGKNMIRLTVKSKEGVESQAEAMINYTGKSSEPAKLYVFAVGINTYEKSAYNLTYAVPDAKGFTEAIQVASKDLFMQNEVKLIENENATKENILKELVKFQSSIKQNDIFIFYYAGHGTMTSASEKDPAVFHLVPYNVTNLYSNDVVKEKGISTLELQKISKDISAQKQLFVIDACQSGGAVEGLASRGALNEKEMANLARTTGTYFLTASGSDQLAGEFAALGHGVFTYSILQAFTGLADGVNKDNKVSVKELSLFVENNVPELSEKYKGQRQYPVSYGFGQDFPIVLTDKYKLSTTVTVKSKYSDYSLEQLQKMKKDAIEKEDFKLADEIKAEIEKRK